MVLVEERTRKGLDSVPVKVELERVLGYRCRDCLRRYDYLKEIPTWFCVSQVMNGVRRKKSNLNMT